MPLKLSATTFNQIYNLLTLSCGIAKNDIAGDKKLKIMASEIKILDKLSINQNVICLVLSYIGVERMARIDVEADFLCCYAKLLCIAQCLCILLFIVCLVSVGISMYMYTTEYWAKKRAKRKTYTLRLKNKQKIAALDTTDLKTIDNLLKWD